MAKQFNYFGGQEAMSVIVAQVEKALEKSCFVPSLCSAAFPPTEGIPLHRFLQTVSEAPVAIFECHKISHLKWRNAASGKVRVDLKESPVFELDPGTIDPSASKANQGRLYLATSDKTLNCAFDKTVRALKRNSEPFQYGHKYWVFKDATRMGFLAFFLGKTIPNPVQCEP